MPIKIINAWGTTNAAIAVNGIDYAINNGALLLNGSYGGDFSQSEQSAISRALGRGRLFIAAAREYPVGGGDQDQSPIYPASYSLDNIVSVLATTHNDEKAGLTFGRL